MSLDDSRQVDYFSMDLLPVMASDHSYTTNKLELLKITEFITCWPCARALECMDDGCGQNFTLSIKYTSSTRCIAIYFLTTESDKHMCLLTVLYMYIAEDFHWCKFSYSDQKVHRINFCMF